jgi:GT2 family glycosyltransferase
LDAAVSAGAIAGATVWLIDNGSNDPAALDRLVGRCLPETDRLAVSTVRGQGNVGYGRAHDLAILQSSAPYHLVLNPDVVLSPDALVEGLRYLADHPETGLVTPFAVDEAGKRQYLCKRYPSVIILGLRGFAPGWLKRPFRAVLDRYEMRDLAEDQVAADIPIASGCFMLARGNLLRDLGGFSPDYFLYFEDFDLSLRLRRKATIAYVPRVRIVHTGGEAARKGWAHRRMFIRSAATFFRRNGWRLL